MNLKPGLRHHMGPEFAYTKQHTHRLLVIRQMGDNVLYASCPFSLAYWRRLSPALRSVSIFVPRTSHLLKRYHWFMPVTLFHIYPLSEMISTAPDSHNLTLIKRKLSPNLIVPFHKTEELSLQINNVRSYQGWK